MKTPLGRDGNDAPREGMRINQRLAREGYATRRGADELIEKGLVTINGRRAQLGDRVLDSDVVEVSGKRSAQYAYVLFHKPAGMDTHDEDADKRGAASIGKSLPPELRALGLFPVGRLDKESRGLLLLTNDGRVTDRLLNPEYAHEKTYEVETFKPVTPGFKKAMEAGVDIDGYVTRPAEVEVIGEKKFRITITEGKKHQIRRMATALRNEVMDLKRTRIMGLMLGGLPAGKARVLEGAELEAFLKSVGL